MNEEEKRIVLALMFSEALIEIRATESLRTAQALADIFHNVPADIACLRQRSSAMTIEIMFECAGRNGMRPYVERLWARKVEYARSKGLIGGAEDAPT